MNVAEARAVRAGVGAAARPVRALRHPEAGRGAPRGLRRPRQLEALFQNYSECLHCPTIHPKLASVLPYQSGANDLTEGPFLGGYMEIKAPNESAT